MPTVEASVVLSQGRIAFMGVGEYCMQGGAFIFDRQPVVQNLTLFIQIVE